LSPDKGYVYSWGSGLYGQLGHGDTNNQPFPKLVDSLNEILQYRVFKDQQHDNTKLTSQNDTILASSHNYNVETEELYGQTILESTLKGWESENSQIMNKVSYRTSVILERVHQETFHFFQIE
jgi:hypothetical protein